MAQCVECVFHRCEEKGKKDQRCPQESEINNKQKEAIQTSQKYTKIAQVMLDRRRQNLLDNDAHSIVSQFEILEKQLCHHNVII